MSEQTSTVDNNEPKFYKGGKSKAIRALKSIGEHAVAAADKLLFPSPTGGFGFYPLDAQQAQEAGERAAAEAAAAPVEPVVELTAEQQSMPEIEAPADAEEEQEVPEDGGERVPAANVFSAAATQLTNGTPAAPAPVARAASRTSYTIEKNRPEQNGIKRPSVGGMCRAVWDACDDLRTSKNGEIPTSKEIKALADSKGWNKNNAMIEFYQWRRFNGVTGRSAKAEAAAEAQQPAAV
jgi:hypothetical protein